MADCELTDDALSGLLLSLQGAFPSQRSSLPDVEDEDGWSAEEVGHARTLTGALAATLRTRREPVT